MSRSIGDRIRINHYADLFGGEENGVITIPVTDLYQFRDHPFLIRDDEDMERLCESIQENGILNPVIVRVRPEAGYEIISGHRRTHAAKIIGLTEVPAIVKQMDDDEAVITMVDANLQRETLLPSEKARSYRMKIEAMRHQGKKKDADETSDQIGQKLTSRSEIARLSGESEGQIERYIMLTELVPELLDMVDTKKLPLNAGVTISRIDKNKQKCLCGILQENDIKLSLADAKKIKRAFDENDCSKDRMLSILQMKRMEKRQLILSESDLSKYFDDNVTQDVIKNTVMGLLDKWSRRKER